MSSETTVVEQIIKSLGALSEQAERLPLDELQRLEEAMNGALKIDISEMIGRKQVHTVFEGYAVDPLLPDDFSFCSNDKRPDSHRFWWCRPYIVTRQHGEQTVYWVECLDGGCWDRPTWWGEAKTLEQAADICRTGPNWTKPQ